VEQDKADKCWKKDAESQIRTVQTAGNNLEKKVMEMQDT
jgi:hypothetical protein